MKSPRIFVALPLSADQELKMPSAAAAHLAKVLRMRPGDQTRLFNNQDGRDYPAELISVSKREVLVRTSAPTAAEPTPVLAIHLAIGISKGERMDYAIQKSTELGVCSITPLDTQRCNVRLNANRLNKKMAHWQGVIIAACEQSGRRWLPTLKPISILPEWLHNQTNSQIIMLDHLAENSLVTIKPPTNAISLLIGPEGGLNEQEKQQAQTAGCTAMTMGPRVLRTETAPVVAIAAIQTLWGDF